MLSRFVLTEKLIDLRRNKSIDLRRNLTVEEVFINKIFSDCSFDKQAKNCLVRGLVVCAERVTCSVQTHGRYKICDKVDRFIDWYAAINETIKDMAINTLTGPYMCTD